MLAYYMTLSHPTRRASILCVLGAFPLGVLCVHEFGDGDEAQAFAATGFEDVRQSVNAARSVRDAVVEDDNRSRNQVLRD